MRVLITGVGGFVASHLIDLLLRESNVAIFATRRSHRSDLSNLAHLDAAERSRVEILDADLLDMGSVAQALRHAEPSAIFHLAAQSFVPLSFEAPTATLGVNAVGTANLLEALLVLGANPRVHLCSSSEVYGNVPEALVPIREDAPTNPESPYGVSKLAADRLGAVYWRAWGLPIITTRAFTHSGARRGSPFFDSAFCLQIAKMEHGEQEPALRVGNLDSVRTVCDVRDLVECYWRLVREGAPGEVYNVGGSETYSVGEVVEMLRALTSVKFEVRVDAALLRPTDITNQRPCLDKVRAAIGWHATTPYRKTLKAMLDYWRDEVERR